MTERGSSSGGLTGATGDLTPDDIQRDFEPGEWRETSDPAHHADVTRSQAAGAPAQLGEIGDPGGELEVGGPTNMATRESGYGSEAGLSPNDPAYRMEVRPESDAGETDAHARREPRMGGDDLADHEEHL
ncbi:MAG TPA: hypothetical protein VJ975_05400 [Candidatus Limnocylindria bacterium]|nr:hypothetical protein [Candidatus Limnocylindria bacterium]